VWFGKRAKVNSARVISKMNGSKVGVRESISTEKNVRTVVIEKERSCGKERKEKRINSSRRRGIKGHESVTGH
jgi:hypothetical protein